jgi:transposase-like protein
MIEEVVKHVPGATFVGDQRSVAKRTPTKVYARGHCRPSFKMQVNRRANVVAFLRRVRPYLWEKVKQADIVLRWADGELDGATASQMCKKAKRFTFAERGPIPAAQRKRRPSGTESHAAAFTARQIRTIRRRFANGERASELASEYGVGSSNIGLIARGVTYKREGGTISAERRSRRVFSDEEAREVRKRLASGERQNALAKEYGVGTATLNRYAHRS